MFIDRNAMSKRKRNRKSSPVTPVVSQNVDATHIDEQIDEIVDANVERVANDIVNDEIAKRERVDALLIELSNATSRNEQKRIRRNLRKNGHYRSVEKRNARANAPE